MGTNDETQASVEEPEQKQDRAVDFLVDNHIPYSDMTATEIEAVIEYKSEVKAQYDTLLKVTEIQQEAAKKVIQQNQETAEKCKQAFNELVAKVTGIGEIE